MSACSSRRYLSLWLRRLSTDRIERRSPAAPAEAARVVAASVKGGQRIVALNDASSALGLRAGMPLADACAMFPMIAVAEDDPEADQGLLEAVADWCDRYTPLVGLDPPDGLALDITGCAHLFGGEASLGRDLLARLERQGFAARVGIADSYGGAHAVARHRPAGGIVPVGGLEAALARLPLAALRLSSVIVSGLKTMGLVAVADLAARPRAPLAARFGAGLVTRLDQALGRVDEPISPRLPVPEAMAEQPFPEPIAREADVLGTIESLAGRLATVLERRGEGARLVSLALFRADGKVHRLEIGTGAPLRDPARMRKLFQDRLAVLGDSCDPGFGYDLVRLSARIVERVDPVQSGLAAPDHDADLAHLIDRFGARFGLRRVLRLVPQDTHIPEFAVLLTPAHAVRAIAAHAQDSLAQDSLAPLRPLRLFDRPELVEAFDVVPDGAPFRFVARAVAHRITAVEGPERIALQWWGGTAGIALARDYFRVEAQDGLRVWLYRDGAHGPSPNLAEPDWEQPRPRPRWYSHGLLP